VQNLIERIVDDSQGGNVLEKYDPAPAEVTSVEAPQIRDAALGTVQYPLIQNNTFCHSYPGQLLYFTQDIKVQIKPFCDKRHITHYNMILKLTCDMEMVNIEMPRQ
jgi:hypothetical protein